MHHQFLMRKLPSLLWIWYTQHLVMYYIKQHLHM